MKTRILLGLLIGSALWTACSKHDSDPYQEPAIKSTVIMASGDSAGISAKLTELRNLLGATLNTAPGAVGGRREINWDAVPASFTNNNNFPHSFFNTSDPALPNGRKRGFVIENTAVPFRVDSTSFVDIASSYIAQFRSFSPKRLFMSMSGNETIGIFKVPGTNTDAFVKGFGVIFADVDQDNSAKIEFFNGSRSLGVFAAPKSPATLGFSLLGVYFPDEKVTKVKITSGQSHLGTGIFDVTTSGGTLDLVTMDDFLYDEPQAQQ
jgi:hypothetical protein